jgi:tRNA pseudouridine65 synthase
VLQLRIVTQNDSWLVVDKPAGFHAHPPEDPAVRMNPRWNALGILERQLGARLAPAHRLDRAASGLLVYARETAARAPLQAQFSRGEVAKTYFVLARGEVRGPLELRDALDGAPGLTRAEPCFSFPLPIPHPRGGDRKFTVLAVTIGTGRFHQIRRHLARAGFPLVGDSRHGDRKLNRAFAELTGLRGLFLRCMTLSFRCPATGKRVSARARWSRDWHELFERAGACALASAD